MYINFPFSACLSVTSHELPSASEAQLLIYAPVYTLQATNHHVYRFSMDEGNQGNGSQHN